MRHSAKTAAWKTREKEKENEKGKGEEVLKNSGALKWMPREAFYTLGLGMGK